MNSETLNKSRLLSLTLLTVLFSSMILSSIPVGKSAAFSKAYLSLTFDDGTSSEYTTAYPDMANRSLVGTVYVILGKIGQSGFMTSSQILDLQNNGWEIGSHTVGHSYFVSGGNSSESTQEYELATSYANLTAMGYRIYGIAYPGGEYTDVTLKYAAKYYEYGRKGGNLTDYAYLLHNQQSKYTLCSVAWDAKTLAQAEADVDAAIANNGWLISVNHGIGDAGQMNTSTWNSLMDYIKSKVDARILIVDSVIGVLSKISDKTSISEQPTVSASGNLDFRNMAFKNVTMQIVGENSTNFAQNGGFETVRAANPNLPEYWTNQTNSSIGNYALSTYAHSGTYSYILNRTSSSGASFVTNPAVKDGSTRAYVSVTQGKWYTVTAWIASNSSLRLDIYAYYRGKYQGVLDGTSDNYSLWHQIGITTYIPTAFSMNQILPIFYLPSGTTGVAYIDDVTVTQTSCLTNYTDYSTTPAMTTNPSVTLNGTTYSYNGSLNDGQTRAFAYNQPFAGNIPYSANISGSAVALLNFSGTQVAYVDKGWFTEDGTNILYDRTYNDSSALTTLYSNSPLQFISNMNYNLSSTNTEGATFYFASTGNTYSFTPSQPFFVYSTDNITQASFDGSQLAFSLSAVNAACQIQINVGKYGQPFSVSDASWAHNSSTGILTLTTIQGRNLSVTWATNSSPRSFDPITWIRENMILVVVAAGIIIAAAAILLSKRR